MSKNEKQTEKKSNDKKQIPTKKEIVKKEESKAVDTPQPTQVSQDTNTDDYASVLDYIKQMFFDETPDASKDGAGASFFKPDIFNISAEVQNEYFGMLKNLFMSLNVKKPQTPLDNYIDSYYNLLEMITEMAVCGCVPAMDYLCFIYKKGVEDVLPINLVRAHEWGLLAIAGGSRLSPDRLRMFLDPVYSYITENDLLDAILAKHPTDDDEEIINYIAYNFANIFNEKQGLTLEYISKKEIIADESFQIFLKQASKVRDDSLPIMAKYIA